MSDSELFLANQWIRTRQSIYPTSYTGAAIPDETIWELLHNANAAPSHRHTEPWRFHVIPPHKLEAFAEFYQSSYKQATSPEKYSDKKYDKIKKKALKSSHILIVNMQRDPAASVPEWEEVAAVACAVQNIYLSLKPMGIAGYWSSPGVVIDNIGDFIELKAGEQCLGLFYLGIPEEIQPALITKGDVADKVTWLS